MFDISTDSDDEAEVLTWGDVRDEWGKVQIFFGHVSCVSPFA